MTAFPYAATSPQGCPTLLGRHLAHRTEDARGEGQTSQTSSDSVPEAASEPVMSKHRKTPFQNCSSDSPYSADEVPWGLRRPADWLGRAKSAS